MIKNINKSTIVLASNCRENTTVFNQVKKWNQRVRIFKNYWRSFLRGSRQTLKYFTTQRVS